jgi:thiamine kinase-like enzyme
VYRVDAAGASVVLKIAGDGEPLAAWRRKLAIREQAARAGLAPPVVHADEARRAVVSAFVADRSFPAFYRDPRTHQEALLLLGRTLRRVHELPSPADADALDPRAMLAALWTGRLAGFTVPAFVAKAVHRVLDEEPPVRERALVLSHNDVNPSNLVYDGERLLLVDWENAGAGDPFFDLAAISVFARMDEAECRTLLGAHDGEPVAALPDRFTYVRRLVAVLCGAVFLNLARQGGHAGAKGGETTDTTPSLAEFYQRLQTGGLSVASSEGQWCFGLALVRESCGP